MAGEPRLGVVGGAPGTGKSTVAGAVADRLGATLLRSDRLRRELPDPAARSYTAHGKDVVYARLIERARCLLRRGEHVVLDATWPDERRRREAQSVAEQTASRFTALECRTSLEIAAARAEHRWKDGIDDSDAGPDIARRLAAVREPWSGAVKIDTSGTRQQAAEAAKTAVQSLNPTPTGS